VDGALPHTLMKLDETGFGFSKNLRGHAKLWYENSLPDIRRLPEAARDQGDSQSVE
jgi:hypothetical protein